MRRLFVPAVLLAATACGTTVEQYPDDSVAVTPEVTAAAESISAQSLLQHIRNLAHDSLEGRAPGTPGELKAVAYIESQFKALGLAPGNPDGTYRQKVELIGYTPNPTASFTAGGRAVPMRFKADFVANSRHDRPETKVENSDIVFVGYGVDAPEYGWDDFKGVDVKGKTLVMLINDPAVLAAGRTSSGSETTAEDMAHLDSAMFRGKAMTYYGRWTYKYEEATRRGAAAVFIVHETVPAAYGWNVVQSSWSGEQLDVISPDADKRVPVEGWITLAKAKQLFAAAGQNWDSLHAAARTKEFRPVTLNAKANVTVKTTVRRMESWNVLAKLEGKGALKEEYVVYTAHHDHLGRDTSKKGDQINNGALDNASGVGTVLEIAKAFTKLPEKPSRSVLFLMVAAEESGLLGAKYYANNPLYPLAKTAGIINIDGINQWGKTSDFTVVGLGNTDLDDVLTSVLQADGRTVRPDPEPEKGFYYRSDHFEFAKKGVPALDPDAGVTYVGKDSTYGMTKRDEYTKNDYHGPTDEIKPDWDLAGAIDDARVLFRVGYLVAQRAALPEWKTGTEFKAIRDSMMKK